MFNNSKPFVILGPCVIESAEHTELIAAQVKELAHAVDLTPIFKASFEKANRTSVSSFVGHGIENGLRILASIRDKYGLPVTTDVHETTQVAQVAEVVDILQIPAFLCRQTPLLKACAESGKVVNVKKAQFLSGEDMIQVVNKLRHFGASTIIVTERGTMFGYNNLVVDFRNISIMQELDVLICMDATHSVQRPGGHGASSAGDRRFVPVLARAAAAVGVDGYFMETHDNPDVAPSDGPNMVPLKNLGNLLQQIRSIHEVSQQVRGLTEY